MTKDTMEIKLQVYSLIQEWTQQELLVHIISILNVTRYATQINIQKVNEVMDVLLANEDMNILLSQMF